MQTPLSAALQAPLSNRSLGHCVVPAPLDPLIVEGMVGNGVDDGPAGAVGGEKQRNRGDVGCRRDTDPDGAAVAPPGDLMNEQIAVMLGLGAMCVCSAAFALMVPTLAIAVGRGRLSTAARVSAVMAALAVITIAVAATVGSSTAAYALVT